MIIGFGALGRSAADELAGCGGRKLAEKKSVRADASLLRCFEPREFSHLALEPVPGLPIETKQRSR
jgi:hypothetical protein